MAKDKLLAYEDSVNSYPMHTEAETENFNREMSLDDSKDGTSRSQLDLITNKMQSAPDNCINNSSGSNSKHCKQYKKFVKKKIIKKKVGSS